MKEGKEASRDSADTNRNKPTLDPQPKRENHQELE